VEEDEERPGKNSMKANLTVKMKFFSDSPSQVRESRGGITKGNAVSLRVSVVQSKEQSNCE
jgi:hypothetical protein